METRLALIPDNEDTARGVVKPIAPDNGGLIYGKSVGYYTSSTPDGNIHVVLYMNIDTIIHEVATSKAIRAELRAAKKDNEGEEIKPNIEYDPVTKRFREVLPVKEKKQ